MDKVAEFGEYLDKKGSREAPAPTTLPLVWYGDVDGPASYEQLVRGLILKGSFFVVYGESNSGKTFFILDLALCIAQGRLWRGQKTRQGLVIYVAGEGASSVRNRVAAYRKANPDVVGSLAFAIIPQSVDFMDALSVAKLVETIKLAEDQSGQKVAMVIIDTLARAMAGGEENSTQDMGMVVSAADFVRAATGAAVGFVHHTGKDAAKGARGSSALRAATDTEILIEGTEGARKISITKQRDLEPASAMSFGLQVIEIGTDPDDFMPITSCVVKVMDESDVPVYIPEPTGKNSRRLLTKLRELTKEVGQKPYTVTELRRIAQDVGMVKASAVTAVDTLTGTPFMKPFGGAFVFTDGEG